MADKKNTGGSFAKANRRRKEKSTCRWGHLLVGDNVKILKHGERHCMICQAARCAYRIEERRKHREAKMWTDKTSPKHTKKPAFFYTQKYVPLSKNKKETEHELFMRLYGDKKKYPKVENSV